MAEDVYEDMELALSAEEVKWLVDLLDATADLGMERYAMLLQRSRPRGCDAEELAAAAHDAEEAKRMLAHAKVAEALISKLCGR